MKKFSAKRALLLSVLSMVICVSMLIGSTFAWFTDSATANVNTIQSGNLDVELQVKNADGEWVSAEGTTPLDFVKLADHESEAILWEPGCTYNLPELRVVNKGNLALKYQLVITGATGDTMLLDVIKFKAVVTPEGGEAVTSDNAYGTTLISDGELLAGKYATLNISAHMDETAGNDYRDKAVSGIAIKVVATQLAHEYDSNGNQYDKSATYLTYPADVTTKSFEEATSVAYTDIYGRVQTGTKPAVAAYVDSDGATKYAADIKAAVTDGATVIYCKKDADMKINATGTNRTEAVTADLTIYANGADFGYGEIALNSSTAGANTLTGNVNIKVYDAKNVKIWGNTPADGVTWNIEMVNCHNEGNGATGSNGEMIMLWGSTGTVNATVTNCSVTKADLGIYFGCDGSLTVKDSDFTECATGIKISYKGAGTRTDRIENCTFTNCGCTAEMAGTGSTSYLADDSAAYKYKNGSAGTITLTTKGNTITGTIGEKGDTQIVGTVTVVEE